MPGLEALRARNRYEETLPSGLSVTIRLPRIRDCIIAGHVPLPVLQRMTELAAAAESNGSPSVSVEDAEHMARFQDEIVRRAVVAIDGEAVELALEDVADFGQEDYDRIVAFCTRDAPLPAGSPT